MFNMSCSTKEISHIFTKLINTIGCSHNVPRFSLILILFKELFVLIFIRSNFLQSYILVLLCCGLSRGVTLV